MIDGRRCSVRLFNFPAKKGGELVRACAERLIASGKKKKKKVDDKVSIPSAAAAYWRLTPRELAYCPDTGISHSSS